MLGLVCAGLQGLNWYGFEGFILGLQTLSMLVVINSLRNALNWIDFAIGRF